MVSSEEVTEDEMVMLEPDDWVSSVKCSTLLLIFVMTLSSNMFVLWAVFLRSRSYRFCARSVYGKVSKRARRSSSLSRVQLFMMHLSIADILVALLNILPQLAWDITARFYGGALLCKFVKYAQVLVLYLSTYILTGMSLDRLISMRAIHTQWKTGMRANHRSSSTRRTEKATSAEMSSSKLMCKRNGSLSGGSSGKTKRFSHGFNSHQSRAGYRKFAKLLIALAWLLSSMLALPQLFIFSYTASPLANNGNNATRINNSSIRLSDKLIDGQGVNTPMAESNSTGTVSVRYDCRADFSWHPHGMEIYVTSFVVIILGVPASLMLFCYGYMCIIILRIQRSYICNESQPLTTTQVPQFAQGTTSCYGNTSTGFAASSKKLTAAKIRLMKMTFSVVLAFIFCWSPFCVAELFRAYTLPVDNAQVSPMFMILLLLASLNSAVNPWIYAAFYTNRYAKRHQSKAKTSSLRYR